MLPSRPRPKRLIIAGAWSRRLTMPGLAAKGPLPSAGSFSMSPLWTGLVKPSRWRNRWESEASRNGSEPEKWSLRMLGHDFAIRAIHEEIRGFEDCLPDEHLITQH